MSTYQACDLPLTCLGRPIAGSIQHACSALVLLLQQPGSGILQVGAILLRDGCQHILDQRKGRLEVLYQIAQDAQLPVPARTSQCQSAAVIGLSSA